MTRYRRAAVVACSSIIIVTIPSCSLLGVNLDEREKRSRAAAIKADELEAAGYAVGLMTPREEGPPGSGWFRINCYGKVRTIAYGAPLNSQTASANRIGWWVMTESKPSFFRQIPSNNALCQ